MIVPLFLSFSLEEYCRSLRDRKRGTGEILSGLKLTALKLSGVHLGGRSKTKNLRC